jgi:hypothetical protein
LLGCVGAAIESAHFIGFAYFGVLTWMPSAFLLRDLKQ